MDVEGHGDDPEKTISSIRKWLCSDARFEGEPASTILRLFREFESEFPEILKEDRIRN
jgi:hypothetical protein